MSQDFEKYAKMAVDAEQQWKQDMEQVAEELSATKFHDTSASMLSSLEEYNAMRRAQDQAPLDIVAELKAINERLNSAESEAKKQQKTDRWQFIFTAIVGILTLVAGVVAAVAAICPLIPK